MNEAKNWQQAIEECSAFLRPFIPDNFQVAVVLGTGLGALLQQIEVQHTIPYGQIPHFPEATVEFHKGQLVFGRIGKVGVIVMQGRFHYYEGYSMQEITFPIRVLAAMGMPHLLLSNAAGGINKNFKKGDLVLLEDHINLQPDNPLRGMNDASFGNRFPDMSAPYHSGLNAAIQHHANNQLLQMRTGVYASVMGPNLETRAEYRYLRMIGADMVGMSTVPEVIVANQLNIPCAAVSVITDECDPDNLKPVDIAEIIAVAGQADKKLSALFADVIANL